MVSSYMIQVFKDFDAVNEPAVLLKEFIFYLQDIPDPPAIKIKIYHSLDRDTDPYYYSLSHYLQTPIQAGPYTPSAPLGGNEEQVLRSAINAVTGDIKQAIRAGHQPSSTWLIENEDF